MNEGSFGKDVTTQEVKKSAEIKWLGTQIRPMSYERVREISNTQHSDVLNFPDEAYNTRRGVRLLLNTNSRDYARLPQFNGLSALEIFKQLPPNSRWLDIGCGSGDFIKEVLSDVNPVLDATGYDARTWETQKKVPKLVLGDLQKIDQADFQDNGIRFDIITSSSVFYHLPDYLGA